MKIKMVNNDKEDLKTIYSNRTIAQRTIISTIAFILMLCCSVSPSFAFLFPDTGQTKCYDLTGAEIVCEGTDHDGAYSINPMTFTDNEDGTITDDNTDLIWQKADDGILRTWEEAIDYCESLDLAGSTDWELPTKKELLSIVNYGESDPAAAPEVFITHSDGYWSISESAGWSGYFWFVDFYDGYADIPNGSFGNYVRCVRGEPWNGGQLTENYDDTITDQTTGLTWQKTETEVMNWLAALDYCSSLTLAGYIDWRLPNIKELESISNDLSFSPAADLTFFPNMASASYWSSTFYIEGPGAIWLTNFSDGTLKYDDAFVNAYVRCVRGPGQNPSFPLLVNLTGTGEGYVRLLSGTLSWNWKTGYAEFSTGTPVTLIAAANQGSVFSGWSGCESTTENECHLTMDGQKNVSATFTSNTYTLTVNKAGNGSGTVSGGGAFDRNTSHQITASATLGSTFTGWSGDCSGNATPLDVLLDRDKTCIATFSLTGAPKISVSPTSVNLGSVRRSIPSAPKSVKITNTGKGTLIIGATISGVDKNDFSLLDGCGGVVGPGASCAITVTLTSTSFGKKIATLEIASNDQKKTTSRVKLSGNAKPPVITTAPSSIKWNSVPVGVPSGPKMVKVGNKGSSDLLINSIIISGTDAADFSQMNDCTTVVSKGSCTISITYTPTSAGKKAATLKIVSNDQKKQTATVRLSAVAK